MAQNRYLGLGKTETATAAYTLWDASANIEFNYLKNQTLQFQVAVNNILNTAYQSHLSRLQILSIMRTRLTGKTASIIWGEIFV